jgi:hypothetical protein
MATLTVAFREVASAPAALSVAVDNDGHIVIAYEDRLVRLNTEGWSFSTPFGDS